MLILANTDDVEVLCPEDVTKSSAIAEGPRDVGVPVEILPAVERLYNTPNEYRSRVLCQPHGLRQSPFTSPRLK